MAGIIGDVKYSVLAPNDFRALNGQGWVLFDGGIDLHKTYDLGWEQTRLSALTTMEDFTDARGVFVRNLNGGRKKEGDTEIDRKLGTLQGDKVGPHEHRIKDKHASGSETRKGSRARRALHEKMTISTRDTACKDCGDESRPRNIALYCYIKVFDEDNQS